MATRGITKDFTEEEREERARLTPTAPEPPYPPSPSFLEDPNLAASVREVHILGPATPTTADDTTPRASHASPSAPPAPAFRPPMPTPQPTPWMTQARLVALPAMTRAIVATAAIWAGLAVSGVALAFGSSITLAGQLALGVVGAYLIAGGAGVVVSTRPELA